MLRHGLWVSGSLVGYVDVAILTKELRAAVMSPLALLMLVAAQRREIAKTEKKVTIPKLHEWIRKVRWNRDSELFNVKLNFLDTPSARLLWLCPSQVALPAFASSDYKKD